MNSVEVMGTDAPLSNIFEKEDKYFENKVVIVYAHDNGTSKETFSKLEEKFNGKDDYHLIYLEDLDETNLSFYLSFTRDRDIVTNINRACGVLEEDGYDMVIPNFNDMYKVYKIIEDSINKNKDIIVCCSAGVSRSGNTASYILQKGYKDVTNKEHRYAKDGIILEMLNLIDKDKVYNKAIPVKLHMKEGKLIYIEDFNTGNIYYSLEDGLSSDYSIVVPMYYWDFLYLDSKGYFSIGKKLVYNRYLFI